MKILGASALTSVNLGRTLNLGITGKVRYRLVDARLHVAVSGEYVWPLGKVLTNLRTEPTHETVDKLPECRAASALVLPALPLFAQHSPRSF